MQKIRPQALYLGLEAIPSLIAFCHENNHRRLLMIADQNTYGALGKRLYDALQSEVLDCKLLLFEYPEVVADAHHILEILIAANGEKRTLIAVGSGTITDLTRFSSHRMGVPFISVPTAPSVDGFTSIGAPTIVRGVKKTLITQPPIAIFADLETLRAAPRQLLAAGFGDMMGKFTAAADFELGHLLWDEPYDAQIAQRTRASAQCCVDHLTEISKATEDGIRTLFGSLVESGYCMLDFGESRPASGAEHHISHFIEMKLLQHSKLPILHGAKVAAATLRIAQLYDAIKGLSQQEVAKLIEAQQPPRKKLEEAKIRKAYGPLAAEIIRGQRPFIELSTAKFESVKQRIIDRWSHIQAIASQVPSAAALTHWLTEVGSPIDHSGLGISAADLDEAYHNGHYLRERLTIRKLVYLFISEVE